MVDSRRGEGFMSAEGPASCSATPQAWEASAAAGLLASANDLLERVPLSDLAPVIRSKNAGPTQLTLDLFFRDAQGYDRAQASPELTADAVASLYGLTEGSVRRYALPAIQALKFTLPRAVCAGSPGDGDVYGAQQHGPLLGLRV